MEVDGGKGGSAGAHHGVSELVIGLTVVAAGTSLPGLATSVLASLRGQRNIAVVNVEGSHLPNRLPVLGLGSLVSPAGVGVPPGALTFDLPGMIAVAVATLPVVFTGSRIARWEGGVFLESYAGYTTFPVLDATNHPAADDLGTAMTGFALPLTVLTLAVVLAPTLRSRSPADCP